MRNHATGPARLSSVLDVDMRSPAMGKGACKGQGQGCGEERVNVGRGATQGRVEAQGCARTREDSHAHKERVTNCQPGWAS